MSTDRDEAMHPQGYCITIRRLNAPSIVCFAGDPEEMQGYRDTIHPGADTVVEIEDFKGKSYRVHLSSVHALEWEVIPDPDRVPSEPPGNHQ